jgi:hypothetical protein
MPHTQSRYMQDLGFTDGKIFCGVGDVIQTGTAGPTTRNTPGYSLNFPVSSTSFIACNLTNQILRRLGMFEDLQEQFGGAGIPASAQPQFYRPDIESTYGVQMSKAQQLNPRTAYKTKGFRLVSYDVIYLIAGATITTHNTRVDQVQFVNNVAQANTVILAVGANGLATTVQANPYVTTITPTFQQYFTLNDGQVWIEIDIVTPGGGTYNFYGLDVLVEYNYN